MANKKGANAANAPTGADASSSAGSSLIICRNKHWRYISSFHGPWLQLPPEILESLAHQNYTMPRPRLIDPAVFYDIVKIRRAVDEATDDSVRATTGTSNSAMNNHMSRLDPFGGGGGTGPKMSKERIYKIRQKAVRALAKAYSLDEVAASVATMQSSSSLEEVASHVLRRDKNDIDARYVHFFHEKIPSRQMEHYTPLEPLTDIMMNLPWEMQAAPLRTRALVQIFKAEYEGAVNDLTLSLHIAQELKIRHKPGADQLVLAKYFKEEQEKWNKYGKDWRQVPQLKEEDQPSSLEQQILFNRAGVHLTIACQHVHDALDGLKEYNQKSSCSGKGEGTDETPRISREEHDAHQSRLEARKRVKTYAKRALKDYMGFLEHFDYTPGLPIEITDEIMRRVYDLANGNRQQTPLSRNKMIEMVSSSSTGSTSNSESTVRTGKPQQQDGSGIEWDADGWPRLPKPEIYPASALFAASPIPNLPKFPDQRSTMDQKYAARSATRETVTYHPLLTDALHSLLLAHSLLQTSSAEILRHAHNTARLARIVDGYPIFQAARSPARADWIEVLRRANNWIGLSRPWQKLCQPAPPPIDQYGNGHDASSTAHGSSNGDALAVRVRPASVESEERKRERRKQEAILDALADERVVDEDSFQRAVRAREKRAIEDEEGLSGPLNDKIIDDSPSQTKKSASTEPATKEHTNSSSGKPSPAKFWAQDDGKEYPISTDRAEAIARWIRDAPLSMGNKKKRPAKKKSRPTAPGAALNVHLDNVLGMPHGGGRQDDEEVD